MTSSAFETGRTATDTSSDAALGFRCIAFIGTRDLEQCQIVEAPIRVALGSTEQARQKRRTHIGHLGSDRIAQLELRPATAKGFCGTFRDERPRNGLHHAARSKRPLGIARADLQRCQDLAIDGRMTGQRLRLNQIDAVNAHDLFDQIRLAIDIGTPGGNHHIDRLFFALRHEAEARQDIQAGFGRNIDTGKTLDFGAVEPDRLRAVALIAGNPDFGRRAAAEFKHQLRRTFGTRNHEFRIDTAFETIPRIGNDAERTARACDVHRVPKREFDDHIDGVFVTAGMLAAHESGNRFDTVLIGDHDIVRIQRIFLAVEAKDRLAIPGTAHGKAAP